MSLVEIILIPQNVLPTTDLNCWGTYVAFFFHYIHHQGRVLNLVWFSNESNGSVPFEVKVDGVRKKKVFFKPLINKDTKCLFLLFSYKLIPLNDFSEFDFRDGQY